MPKKSAARLKAEKAALSREDVIIGLKDAVTLALEKENVNGLVAAWEKLGKTLALFTDVSLQEHRFQEMTPEKFAAELDELIEDDLIREHIRGKLEAYDQRRYGGQAPPGRGGVAGGAGPASGPVSPQAASAPIIRGRVH